MYISYIFRRFSLYVKIPFQPQEENCVPTLAHAVHGNSHCTYKNQIHCVDIVQNSYC